MDPLLPPEEVVLETTLPPKRPARNCVINCCLGMDRSQFYARLDELLDMPPGTLTGAERLEELEGWDSVTLVTFLAMVDEHYSRKLAPRAIGQCETAQDLAVLIENSTSS